MHLHHLERSAKSSLIAMSSSHQRIEALRRLMQLEERRSVLQDEVHQLSADIDTLQTDLFTPSRTPRSRRRTTPLSSHTAGTLPPRRMARGELRAQILESLRAAGDKGVLVRELASLLRIKPVNIHSWFHSAARRYPGHILKTGAGRYQLAGNLEFPQPVPTPASPNLQRSFPRRVRSRRGEMSRRILDLLAGAGRDGISVQEIASRLGANFRNIHVWFSSQGKKNPQILKIGRGRFSLSSAPAA
jgi:hypothetical protein